MVNYCEVNKMNELMNNFINQIEDVNKIKEMSVEEFIKLVKANKLISEEDGNRLIASFKKISSNKASDDESDDNDQRKKKYRQQHKELNSNDITKKVRELNEKENENDSLER